MLRLGDGEAAGLSGRRPTQNFTGNECKPFGEGDAKLVAEVARQLALWMSYEDIIRVADLKTRATRFERVRREVGAKEGEPVVVIDFLKPGVEEFASLLPHFLGKKLHCVG